MMPNARSSAAGAVALLAALCTATSGPAELSAGDTIVIAVMPLGVDPRDTLTAPLSFALADLLATDLARSKRLTLVERARLGAVLREQSLAASGAVDSATAPRTGRLLRARTLVTGSLIRRAGDDMRFEIRLTDVATGGIESARAARAPLNDVLAAEKALAFQLFDRFEVQLTPRERALVEQRPTRSLAALLAYGQGVQAEVNAQYAAAFRAYAKAKALDPTFREAAVRVGDVRALRSVAAMLAVNGVNRPLDLVPAEPRRGLATDPSLVGQRGTITVRIARP